MTLERGGWCFVLGRTRHLRGLRAGRVPAHFGLQLGCSVLRARLPRGLALHHLRMWQVALVPSR